MAVGVGVGGTALTRAPQRHLQTRHGVGDARAATRGDWRRGSARWSIVDGIFHPHTSYQELSEVQSELGRTELFRTLHQYGHGIIDGPFIKRLFPIARRAWPAFATLVLANVVPHETTTGIQMLEYSGR